MMPVPWRCVESWNCIACGLCCHGYKVVLRFSEWVHIIRKYGMGVTQPGLSKFFLGKKGDGTCIFLSKVLNAWFCGLQSMKPRACKLWPFKIFSRPKFGRSNEAIYKHQDKDLFVYADPACIGIRWGKPMQEFTYRILPEFVEIALGLQEKQYYSTSKILYRPQYFRVRGRKIV
jgi:Fe-S-cluster containining protein